MPNLDAFLSHKNSKKTKSSNSNVESSKKNLNDLASSPNPKERKEETKNDPSISQKPTSPSQKPASRSKDHTSKTKKSPSRSSNSFNPPISKAPKSRKSTITSQFKNQIKIKIFFQGSDLVIKNLPSRIRKELIARFNTIWHPKKELLHIKPLAFWKINQILKHEQNHVIETKISDPKIHPYKIIPNFQLRPYQKQAYQCWVNQGKKGIVIFPTGAGKTFLGLFTLANVNLPTLIVVPTIELLDQWYNQVKTSLQIEKINSKCSKDSAKPSNAIQSAELDQLDQPLIGRYGGGHKTIGYITITTYTSGYMYVQEFRDKFALIIFDEVHHLTSESHRILAEGAIAQYRLGLTATLDSKDSTYPLLTKLTGPIIYRKKPQDLTEKGHLAPYDLHRIPIQLTPTQLEQYNQLKKIYTSYLQQFRYTQNAFQQMIFRANQDPQARKALLAYNQARDLSFNASQKLPEIQTLIKRHPTERILIFCENVDFVEKVSRQFALPALTNRTPRSERDEIMHKFRSGKYRIIVTGKVLDEGVDVPEVSVGIIISGTGTKRQFIQRLGRLLRPLPGKQAELYELITVETTETHLAQKRKRNLT